MNLIIFFSLMFICFTIISLAFPKLREDVLYTFAIGSAINTNIFNVENYGFDFLGMKFGIDSILYSIFIFCVLIEYFYYGKEKARKFTFYTMAAILFTAIVQFLGTSINTGFEDAALWSLISFGVSIIASLIAIWFAVLIGEKLQKKGLNKYLIFEFMFILSTIINSVIFYGLMAIFSGNIQTGITEILLGSVVGKIICLIVSMLAFLSINLYINSKKDKNI